MTAAESSRSARSKLGPRHDTDGERNGRLSKTPSAYYRGIEVQRVKIASVAPPNIGAGRLGALTMKGTRWDFS